MAAARLWLRARICSENRPVRTVGGNGIALEPTAAGVLVEVRTGIGAAVDRLDIKPERIRLCAAAQTGKEKKDRDPNSVDFHSSPF
jgi:hypothetical protein